MIFWILGGLAVYRLSLLADDPRLFKKLKKIHETFASHEFASLWIAAVFVVLNVFCHDFAIFRAVVSILGLSGLACVLGQLKLPRMPSVIFPATLPPIDETRPPL